MPKGAINVVVLTPEEIEAVAYYVFTSTNK